MGKKLDPLEELRRDFVALGKEHEALRAELREAEDRAREARDESESAAYGVQGANRRADTAIDALDRLRDELSDWEYREPSSDAGRLRRMADEALKEIGRC